MAKARGLLAFIQTALGARLFVGLVGGVLDSKHAMQKRSIPGVY